MTRPHPRVVGKKNARSDSRVHAMEGGLVTLAHLHLEEARALECGRTACRTDWNMKSAPVDMVD